MPQKLTVLLLAVFLIAGSTPAGCGPSEDTAEWHLGQAYKLAEQDRYDEAIEECNRAVVLDPDCAEAYNNRAYIYNKLGQYDLAIADCNRAIELDPGLTLAYDNRAFAYEELDKRAEAQGELLSGISPAITEKLSIGGITVNATLDGVPWSGEVSYTIQGPTTESGSSAPQGFSECPVGTYTITYISGGPQGALLGGISPAATEELSTGEAATLTLAFVSIGEIMVSATLDGEPWSGEVSYTIQGPKTESGSSVPQGFSERPVGTYTITYISGGPQGALLGGISPAATEELSTGEAATLTLAFVSIGEIMVSATLDGEPWFGHVNYIIEGPRTESGFSAPQGFSECPIGTYTITYISGGPQGALLSGISPAATEELSAGEAATLTLAFIYNGEITVNATLDSEPWSGEASYTIQGPTTESGSSVPQSFTVPKGTYTITHNSGGPQYEIPRFILLSDISPSNTEEISPGESATFTLVFVSIVGDYGQGANLSVTKSVDNAYPVEGDTITYTITVSSDGPDAATNIEITDTLPVGVTYDSDIPSQGTYSRGIWDVGALTASGSATLKITARVDNNTAGSTVINTAEVTSVDQTDPNSTPNNNNTGEDDQDTAYIYIKAQS